MKIFIVFVLLIFSNSGLCEPIKSDKVQLFLIQNFISEYPSIMDEWPDPVPYINVGIKLKIENVKVILIVDENLKKGICKDQGRGNKLLYFRSSVPINTGFLRFVINHPCAKGMRSEANLSVHVLTFDKKHYYNDLKFTSVHGDLRQNAK